MQMGDRIEHALRVLVGRESEPVSRDYGIVTRTELIGELNRAEGRNLRQVVGFAALAILNRDALRSVLRALSPSGMGPEAAHMAMGRLLSLYYVLMSGLTVTLAI